MVAISQAGPDMTSIRNFITDARARLAAAGIENPELDLRLLVQHVMGMSHPELLMNLNRMLSEVEVKDLNDAVSRRASREPVSRIVGSRGFWKSDFRVSPQTLDPRPDSETIIEEALKRAAPPPRRVLDLGTGTGCLLLSLLQEWPQAVGVGLDISAEAVATARENAELLGLSSRVEFVESDWEKYAPNESFDSIISNPPYIADGEIDGLAPEVSLYDPRAALAGGEDGLDCYRSIAAFLPKWLKKGGWAFLEIGHTQANQVKSLLAEAGLDVINIVPDLAGSDRVVVAKMP